MFIFYSTTSRTGTKKSTSPARQTTLSGTQLPVRPPQPTRFKFEVSPDEEPPRLATNARSPLSHEKPSHVVHLDYRAIDDTRTLSDLEQMNLGIIGTLDRLGGPSSAVRPRTPSPLYSAVRSSRPPHALGSSASLLRSARSVGAPTRGGPVNTALRRSRPPPMMHPTVHGSGWNDSTRVRDWSASRRERLQFGAIITRGKKAAEDRWARELRTVGIHGGEALDESMDDARSVGESVSSSRSISVRSAVSVATPASVRSERSVQTTKSAPQVRGCMHGMRGGERKNASEMRSHR